jgi:hypothetical protein
VKHGAKKFQMLMDIENTVCKGKSLHVHSNNKNHILENHNGKHTHCFLIHLNKKECKKIKNTQIHGLIPKGQRPFSQKTFKTAISSSKSPNEKNKNNLHFYL